MPLLRGISQPFSRLFQSRLTKMICVYGLMEKERQKQTLHSPHSPVSFLTPKDWFLHFLMVWHSADWQCVQTEWEVLSSKRKEFSVCTVQARDYKLGRITADFGWLWQMESKLYSSLQPFSSSKRNIHIQVDWKKNPATTTTKNKNKNKTRKCISFSLKKNIWCMFTQVLPVSF